NKFLVLIITLCLFIIGCSKDNQATDSSYNSTKVKTLLDAGKYVPDIGTFLQIGANIPEGISWEGDKVFFKSSASGASQIYRLTKDGWPYQLTTFEDGIDYFVLSYNSQMAIVGASVGGSEQSQLYLMDTETGRVLKLTDFSDVQIGSVTWARDDKSIYYRSNEENKRDFFLYQMDILTGKSKKIFDNPGYNAIADISQDGKTMIVANYTSNVNNNLLILDLTTDKFEVLNDDKGDVLYGSPTLMPDNKTIWLVCNGNDDGVARVAQMTIGSSKVEYINDGWIDPKWEVEYIAFSRDYKTMGAQINEEGYNRLKIRDVYSKKELPSPPLNGMLGFSGADKYGNILLSFSGPTQAPDCWLWNPHTEKLKQLTFSIYAGIDRKIFTEPKLIKYKSFDGLEIPAFLYLPADYDGKPIPFIVSAHGGPESQFQPRFIRNYQYFMLNGFGIISPNPRGSSGYGREYQNLDNYKLRKNSLKDYKAAVDYLIANNFTQKGMIGIRGGSYGGYVVLGMITEYPNLFDAAIDVVGIANFKSFLQNTKPYRRALRESEYGPLSDPDFLDSISPIHKANLIKTPLFVIHGENDPRVPVGEARQIIKAVKDNNGIVESLIFPDEGHGARKRVNVINSYRRQVEF
ncbi:MAG TPA: S9 family peptidase, partial [candidate division Zixibacteria bacterium]|nr:S9 family peptidase [candidate division Zixibacteria bacterium]